MELEFGGKKIGVTIHLRILKNENLYEFKRHVFSGHYHSKEEKIIKWTKFIRPGALINGINFAVYDTVSGRIEFVNE